MYGIENSYAGMIWSWKRALGAIPYFVTRKVKAL
jgi:hypothetical protein